MHSWNQGFAQNPANARYESLAREIDRAVKFMDACGADFEALKHTEFYTGHEGLLMDYERPMTRIDSRTGTPYVHLEPLHLDRRAHARARRRARRLPVAGAQSRSA